MPAGVRVLCLAFLFAVAAFCGPTWAAQYRPDIVIIKLKSPAADAVVNAKTAMATGVRSLDRLNIRWDIRAFGPTVPTAALAPSRDRHGLGRFYTVELPPGTSVENAVAAYAADPNVELAEPDYIMPVDMVPNDPDYSQQWTHAYGLDKDIDTQEGWDYEVGDSTVIVGILDTGILYTHGDLKASIWVNPGEDLDGDGAVYDAGDLNGVDNDGNGYIDDLIGYDFMPSQTGCWAGEDCNGPDNNPLDFAGHGTHVGGIVAATTDNGVGVAGIAGGQRRAHRPGAKLMALRVGYLANDGRGYVISSACAQAADYARMNGASIINCSWGASSSLVRDAILNAVATGIVVCKSAGNDTSDVPDIVDSTYGVLAISALKSSGQIAPYSNYGAWVDLSAPGDDIRSTYSNLGSPIYANLSGTSMAAPTVAGVAALLKAHHLWFDKTNIDTLLRNYVDDVYGENPTYLGQLGTGRVNARRVLEILTTADFSADVAFGAAPLAVNFTNMSPNAPSGPYDYVFGDGGVAGTPDAAHTYTTPGLFTVSFTGSGPSGPHTRIRPNMIVVTRDTIEYADVEIDVGQGGTVPVRLHNTHPMTEIILPFRLSGTPDVAIDSVSRGPLTADWTLSKVFDNTPAGLIAYRLRAQTTGTPIPVGGGIVAHLWVRVTSGLPGEAETVDSATLGASQYGLRLISEWADFKPRFVSGSVRVPGGVCDCPCIGDPRCDGITDVLDVVQTVAVAFRGGVDTVDPSCPHVGRTDHNCDCVTSVQDVVQIAAVVFRNGSSPFCDPCVSPCAR